MKRFPRKGKKKKKKKTFDVSVAFTDGTPDALVHFLTSKLPQRLVYKKRRYELICTTIYGPATKAWPAFASKPSS